MHALHATKAKTRLPALEVGMWPGGERGAACVVE